MIKKNVLKTITMIAVVTCLTGCASYQLNSMGTPMEMEDDVVTGTEELTEEATEEATEETAEEYKKDLTEDVTDETTKDSVEVDYSKLEIDKAKLLENNIALVDKVSETSPKDNVMISGMSVHYALTMLANGADEEVLDKIEEFLGSDLETANKFYSAFLNKENTDTKNKLVISNSFWTDETLPYDVRDSYIQLLENVYHAEVAEIPMDENGIDKVNKWVDEATDGLVSKALSPGDLTKDTASILINAILLDGKWDTPFEVERTKEVEFTCADGTVTNVEGMYSEEIFYYENEYATGFRKNYDQGEFYMIAVLPKAEGDFTLEDLDIEGFIESGKSTFELNATLDVMLPKIDFEAKYNLTDIIKASGLERMFDEDYNNFPGIYDIDDPRFRSFASSVIQNDRLIIDEGGTKAAAVTSIIVGEQIASVRENLFLRVYLDRPFAVLLMDGETDAPLFVAKIVNP